MKTILVIIIISFTLGYFFFYDKDIKDKEHVLAKQEDITLKEPENSAQGIEGIEDPNEAYEILNLESDPANEKEEIDDEDILQYEKQDISIGTQENQNELKEHQTLITKKEIKMTNKINADIIIYTKDNCPYCTYAKQLLEEKGASYKEIAIDKDTDESKKAMEFMSSKELKTVPQVMINNKLIGGYDDLKKLDNDGNLNDLLYIPA